MLPLTPIIATVVLLYPCLNLVSSEILLLCVEMSGAITIGRIVLYKLSSLYSSFLIKRNKLDHSSLTKWSKRLNSPGGKWFYFTTGCFPGCPDAYFSVACGMMKYNFWFYLWSGFVSKIIKVFIYIALIKFLNAATGTSITSSWNSIILLVVLILTIDLICRCLDHYLKHLTFKEYNITHGRLNKYKWVRLVLPKSDYDAKFILGNNKSPLEVQEMDDSADIICNGGLFDVKAKEPLGQTIIENKVINRSKINSDNGKPITTEECYPLILDTENNLSADFKNSDTTDLLKINNLKSCLCGWGCMIHDYIGCNLYKKEIVHQYPLRRQRLIICQDEYDNYILYAFHKAHYKEVEDLLVSEKLKFAYCLDGGHSTQIYIRGYRLTRKYWFKKGRKVSTCITFINKKEKN